MAGSGSAGDDSGMRTVCGLGRGVQRLIGREPQPLVAAVLPFAGGRRPLLTDQLGEQRRGGAVLDQVDGTTCGSAVLVALSAWADPTEVEQLDGALPASGTRGTEALATSVRAGFGARFDARQRQVHRESTRFWPAALGTSPWGMVAWLRRHAPAAGPYRVRLVDDTSRTDVAATIAEVGGALAAGRPVPLLVGTLVPRHYVLALGAGRDGWRVYEPTSGAVRVLDPTLIGRRALAPVLGWNRLHATLLPR
jgi:hypothetical protein